MALLLVGGHNVAQPLVQVSTPAPDITCDQLVMLAETSVGLICNGLERNKACYGNHLVSVEFQPNSSLTFQKSGDTVDLLQVRKLSTSPLNMQTRDWGIAVIKAQANLPDALPGQNVTFLLYGDTTVDNPSPEMHAVTVSTRIGNASCTQVPDSALLIQSPTGSQVAMKINGADVALGSTAYVTAELNKVMEFAIVEGQGIISANGVTRVVQPGAQVSIPLGGPDGLQANGAPDEPEPFDVNAIQLAPLNLLDRKVTIPSPFVPGQSVISPTNTDTPTPAGEQTTACVPRADWAYRYIIQRGDNLAAIALKLNMRTADLQIGNCVANPNQLVAGQALHVPRPAPTSTPMPTPTFTPEPPHQQVGMMGPNLRADSNKINSGDCTTIRWDVDNIKAVYFENQPTTGHNSQQVCPTRTNTYTLLVQMLDDQRQLYPITINVEAYKP
jgi:hypothetical protein